MPLVSYKDVLPPGLVNKVKSSLLQQLVNMVGKSDTGESYRERALAELEKQRRYIPDEEYRFLLEVVDWITRNIDYVKRKKYSELREQLRRVRNFLRTRRKSKARER